jgi:serine/threonine-protein kinase
MADPVAMSRAPVPPSPDPDEISSESITRGTSLGRYELLVPVAVGGMARVWAARLHGQRGFTKLVAIKTILPHLASDPEFERMFVDEARIASGVHHPNVCEIYDLGEERGSIYIAMEWVSGDSLSHLMKSSKGQGLLDPRVAGRIVSDAAAGLHAAHNLVDEDGKALQVVHRDVSPHNLLLSLDGNVKVTDFGVAKAVGASHQATQAGQLKGKIAYMAPEQAVGGSIDRRSDVFSLGCVLYQATTGVQPFRGEGEHQIMQELIKGSFAPPSRVIRNYPYELERIVVRALAAQPLHRFQTMEQFRIALEEWIAKSGPVVTQTHVAAVVRERIGAEVEGRRERIRAASALIPEVDPSGMTPSGAAVRPRPSGTPSGVMASSGINAKVPSIPPPRAPHPSNTAFHEQAVLPPVLSLTPRAPTSTQYAMAASFGVLAATALAATGFYVWHSLTAPAPVMVAAAAPSASAAPPVVAKRGAPVAPVPDPVSAATLPAVILFKVVPDKAFLVVDGKALDPTVRTIPRPAAGKPEQVVVRADGFEDQPFTIDDAAAASVDVWLNPAASKPSGSSHHSSGDGTTKPPPEALPANPY